jgi:histidinol-phosphate aminotransferase
MYRVVTEQRGGTVVAVPRLGHAAGWAVDQAAVRVAISAHGATVIWLCSPNNPTALAEPEGAIEELLAGIATDAAAAGRSAPVVVLDEAYAEFVGTTLLALRDAYPNLIVVRTASKAYALAGLRVGFAVARPELIARLNPFRPPGSISTVSITLVTEALRDESILADNLARVETERTRLTEALTEIGWEVGPSVTNFLLVDFTTTERAAAVADGLLRRALVPRTFGEGHPLADHLRLTIRATDENDRLIAAATELARETTA